MKEVKDYQSILKGLHEGEQYIDKIMDIDISFIMEIGGIGLKDLVEEKMDLVRKQKEEMDNHDLSDDYRIGFLIGMKNSVQRKIEESEEEDREIIEEIADLLLEPFADLKEKMEQEDLERTFLECINLKEIKISNGMLDIALPGKIEKMDFSIDKVNTIVLPENLKILNPTSFDKTNKKNIGLSSEMREKIDEAVRLMKTGLSRKAISFMVGLSQYDVEQIYKIYHPEQKEETGLNTNRTSK